MWDTIFTKLYVFFGIAQCIYEHLFYSAVLGPATQRQRCRSESARAWMAKTEFVKIFGLWMEFMDLRWFDMI